MWKVPGLVRNAAESYCYGPRWEAFPNVHCFNGCQRESNETSLTKAVTARSFIRCAGEASRWGELSPDPSSSNACLLFSSLCSPSLSQRDPLRGETPTYTILCISWLVFIRHSVNWKISSASRRTARSNKAPREDRRVSLCLDMTFKSSGCFHCHSLSVGIHEDNSRVSVRGLTPVWPLTLRDLWWSPSSAYLISYRVC